MEAVRFESRVLHPEVLPVTREALKENLDKNTRITLPHFTKYEWTALIGIRAQQLAEGAKPLISLDGFVTSSPQFVWNVAEREVFDRKLPYIIHRQFANGISEYWSVSELTKVW
jgi:DNA-directed RNA polymerase subunit K/omega